jgi:molybdopterin-guanine dinucleotide biosynthesis protein A
VTVDPVFSAIIVAGGKGSRLQGESKPELVIGGRSLLDRTLDACADASHTVIVGGEHLRREGALWACEDPPRSGPAAGLAAGVAALAEAGDASGLVLVLGTDTPRAHACVSALLGGITPGADGAWLIDGAGVAQPLVAVYRRDALERRCVAGLAGASLRDLTAGLTMVGIEDAYGAARDVDTWEDVAYWEGELS